MIATPRTRPAHFAWTLELSSIGAARLKAFNKAAPWTLVLLGELPPLQVWRCSRQPDERLILCPVGCVENALFFGEQPSDDSDPPRPSAFAHITNVPSINKPRQLGEC